MAKCKTVDISKMPHNVLTDFINGDLSFEDAYKMYPSGYSLDISKVVDEAVDQDDNVVTLSVRK